MTDSSVWIIFPCPQICIRKIPILEDPEQIFRNKAYKLTTVFRLISIRVETRQNGVITAKKKSKITITWVDNFEFTENEFFLKVISYDSGC